MIPIYKNNVTTKDAKRLRRICKFARLARIIPEGCRTVAGGNTPGIPPHEGVFTPEAVLEMLAPVAGTPSGVRSFIRCVCSGGVTPGYGP